MYTSPGILQPDFDSCFNVDFLREAKATGNVCGCLPTPDRTRSQLDAGLPIYEASFPIYSRDRWPDMIAERDANQGAGWAYRRIVRMHNQKREGTCVYNMLALLMEIRWATQFGDQFWIPFSPVSGYRWNAPGPGTGSNVGDSIVWSEKKGLLPEDILENLALVAAGYFKHTHPAVGYHAKFQAGWESTAKLFRVMPQSRGGWYRVTTVEGWFSSMFDGNVNGGGRDGHAIGHCGAALDGRNVLSIYGNSWDVGGTVPGWGATLQTSKGPLKMFGFDSEAKVATMVRRGAFVLVNMRRPSFLDRWLAA